MLIPLIDSKFISKNVSEFLKLEIQLNSESKVKDMYFRSEFISDFIGTNRKYSNEFTSYEDIPLFYSVDG